MALCGFGCIISFLYIKPQLASFTYGWTTSCIISFLYIKPQRNAACTSTSKGCIISFLYIKPQHRAVEYIIKLVVLYRFSTSNHNSSHGHHRSRGVVLYRFSTSNHNTFGGGNDTLGLYYIVSLHQTTTVIHGIQFI